MGNDVGMIAMYEVDHPEQGSPGDSMSIYNKVSRTEHDRSILALSIGKTTEKFLSGSMDRS